MGALCSPSFNPPRLLDIYHNRPLHSKRLLLSTWPRVALLSSPLPKMRDSVSFACYLLTVSTEWSPGRHGLIVFPSLLHIWQDQMGLITLQFFFLKAFKSKALSLFSSHLATEGHFSALQAVGKEDSFPRLFLCIKHCVSLKGRLGSNVPKTQFRFCRSFLGIFCGPCGSAGPWGYSDEWENFHLKRLTV